MLASCLALLSTLDGPERYVLLIAEEETLHEIRRRPVVVLHESSDGSPAQSLLRSESRRPNRNLAESGGCGQERGQEEARGWRRSPEKLE